MVTFLKQLSMCVCIFLFGTQAQASDGPALPGFIDINYYPIQTDTKSDNYLTVLTFLKFSDRVNYFGFANFGKIKGVGGVSDKDTFYTEQNLRWKISNDLPFDLNAQFNFRNGADNDRHRIGIRWRVSDTKGLSDFFKSINLSYTLIWHAVQFDHEDPYVWQLEHVFRMTFPSISDRLYLSGFADHTFNQDLPDGFPARPVVGEAQLGYRLVDSLFLVSEYRVNEYRRAEVDNLAFGVEYKLSW